MDKQPLQFSIVIPVHNRDHLIRQTIESALNQTYAGYEIIVIDDSSTDSTPSILASYGEKITKLRLESRDPGINRNAGVKLARGDYIVFLDSDDIILPWALETYAVFLNILKKPPILLAKAKGLHLNDESSVLPTHNSNYQYYSFNDYLSKTVTTWLSASHLIVKRSILDSSLCFHEKTFPFDDLDFILTLGCTGPFIQIASPLTVLHRVHEGNAVKDIKAGLLKLEYILQREKQGLYPGGGRRGIERLSIIGGHVLHWSNTAVKSGIYLAALRMIFAGKSAVLASFFRKGVNLLLSRGVKACLLDNELNQKATRIKD
jgi:glycosyltransferase involved in cell wall biosynthesis